MLADDQNLGGVEGPAGQARSVDVAQCRGELYDVVPDELLLQQAACRGDCIGLLPQEIVLRLGVRSGALTIEGVNQRSCNQEN